MGCLIAAKLFKLELVGFELLLAFRSPVDKRLHDPDKAVECKGLKRQVLLWRDPRVCGVALRYLADVLDHAAKDVVAVEVAVVVDVHLCEYLGVLANVVEELQDQPLLLKRAVGALQHTQENVGEEHANFRLECTLEVAHQAVEDTQCVLEDAWVGAHTVLYNGAAQVSFDGLFHE